MILLTDEEIRLEHEKYYASLSTEGWYKWLSSAQLKNVVEWSGEECPHTVPSYLRFKRECLECWQVLKKEAGV